MTPEQRPPVAQGHPFERVEDVSGDEFLGPILQSNAPSMSHPESHPDGIARQVAPEEAVAQDQIRPGSCPRIESIQGAWYNWLISIITENDIARAATRQVEALGRIRPMPRKATRAQRVSPA